MEQKQTKGPICQSCGMPMNKSSNFGTNVDGSRNEEYCRHCYRNGQFTAPDIIMEQMINKVAGFMAKMEGIPEARAKEIAVEFMPKLRRWQ